MVEHPATAAIHDVRAEIKVAHSFIAAWFRGEVPESAERFRVALADRLAPGLVNIQPAGHALTREELLSAIERGYGASPRFAIAIRDVQVRFASEQDGLVLATYAEVQRGARNSASENTRISTVLLQRRGTSCPFTWLHIHETAVPAAEEHLSMPDVRR